jgi:glycosyltransferase involved in cell wall biosynthesis
MNIWIDGYEANMPQRLGSSQVGFELLKNIERLDSRNNYTILLPSPPLSGLPKPRAGWQYKILKPKPLWTRIALPFALYTAKFKPDIFYSPTHYIPKFSQVKKVVTIFDLSYLHFPQFLPKKDLWKLTNWSKHSINNSSHIMTISEFSKKDIIKNYHIDAEKITVAYPGYDADKFHEIKDEKLIDRVKNKYSISGRYIIYIGTIQPRKNLIKLVEAVSRIDDIKLVIVGKTKGLGREGWMYDEILKAPQKYNCAERVIFTGFAEADDLPYLVNGAEAFVLPSLWEGFGIPALEAMACGTPVIVSNVSSLPEVIGRSGLLINPNSVNQIEQAIRLVISDRKLQIKLCNNGLIRAKKFSWEKMAQTVLKVFEEVGEK